MNLIGTSYDKRKTRMRERYATDPAYKETILARNRKWYADHKDDERRKEQRKAVLRRYYEKQKTRVCAVSER